MQAKLRRIGNGIGLTIPASELQALNAGEGDIVEIEVKTKKIIRTARARWTDPEQWQGAASETVLLDVAPVNDFDDKGWQW